MAGLRPQELLIILVILLVLFGGAKLPQLARNIGRAQKEFKTGLDEGSKSIDEATNESGEETSA